MRMIHVSPASNDCVNEPVEHHAMQSQVSYISDSEGGVEMEDSSEGENLSTRVRSTINRQRERMSNLEQTLGKTASEKMELEFRLRELRQELSDAKVHKAQFEQELILERRKTADLEAKLDVYRRQSIMDKAEIKSLKDKYEP